MSCEKSSNDYLRMLMQLLPPGYAWQWSPTSAGRHLLAAWADELARVNTHFCELANEGIERFVGEMPGWSKPNYEWLLSDKFGINAEVTDGIEPFTCESACTDYLLEESIRYVFIFTVDDVSAVPQSAYDYLNQYKQSHTDYLFRDATVSAEVVGGADSMHLGEIERDVQIRIDPFSCESACTDGLIESAYEATRTEVVNGMHCESPLYEIAQSIYRIICHWSYSRDEAISRLTAGNSYA